MHPKFMHPRGFVLQIQRRVQAAMSFCNVTGLRSIPHLDPQKDKKLQLRCRVRAMLKELVQTDAGTS